MSLIGLPTGGKVEDVPFDTFKAFVPKMANYCDDKDRAASFEIFKKKSMERLNPGFWGEEWDHAVSLCIAHYICITDPHYAQSVDADSAVGGVMSSRSIGGIDYSYDIDKTIANNPAYLWYNKSGYGVALVALSLTRGYVGMVIGT